MRILIALICILLIALTHICFATTMTVPFRCYEQELIEEFKKEGINLDKTDINADGFIENLASSYKIHTYKTPEDVQVYVDVPRRVDNRMRDVNRNRV